MFLTRFKCFFFWLWVNHFCLILCAFDACIPLIQISTTCSESWYQKLEFCVSSFYSYYYLLWWSMHWHSMLALFLLYVFLIWIFSRSYLIQATGFDASRAFYIICSQLITFEQATLFSAYCTCFIALLVSPYVFCFALALICFWLNLILQFTSEFSLSCAELCKVSPDDSDHVIL